MLTLCLCTQTDALLKKIVALKILVWSRGWLATLQILTSSISYFNLVEETHGSEDCLGQCVSFSLMMLVLQAAIVLFSLF